MMGFNVSKNMERLKQEFDKRNYPVNSTQKNDYVDVSLLIDTSNLNDLKSEAGEELFNLLIRKSVEYDSILIDAVMDTGRILEEVFQAVSKKGSKEGLYIKWLEKKSISPRQALRQRQKFNVYSNVKTNEGKKIIKELPIRKMDVIKKIGEDKIIEFLNNSSITKSDFDLFLGSENLNLIEPMNKQKNNLKLETGVPIDIVTLEAIPKKIHDLNNILSIFDRYEEKIKVLSDEERESLSLHLEEINKILQK
ncbi:MAG: hypothetical protein LBT51_10200 [Fusobacteriaceae bacterium]|jgi:hypothetical protein|nr:hypothetical protein [Fusobacteriaceae bacterium]